MVLMSRPLGGDVSVLKDGDAGCGSVAKEQLIKLRAHNVPWAMDVVVEESVKVSVQ